MSKFFNIFLVTVASCAFAFAQSTNIVGAGSETIGFTNLNFSGEAGGDAATLSTLQAFYSTNTAYQGGIGASLSGDSDLYADGGSGLYLTLVAESTVVGSEVIGGDAGSVVQNSVGGLTFAVGGNGIKAGTTALEVAGAIVCGGRGGDISAAGGSFKNFVDGGSGILVRSGGVKLDIVDSALYGGDGGTVVSGGTEPSSAKGGFGVSVQKAPRTKIDSAVFSNLEAFGGNGGSITTLGDADASGGHGVGVTIASGPIVVESGTYVGGLGGSINGAASATANGGDGFRYIGKATENNPLVISNGTFLGAAGGTLTGIAGSATANGGNGLFAENATVDIHGGDFSGGAAGTANGIEGRQGIGLRTTNSTVTIHGGTFDAAEFSGPSTISLQGGDFTGDIVFNDDIVAELALGTNLNVAGGIVQLGGAVNVNAWADSNFEETYIFDGAMNFVTTNNQTFNLGNGNSFKLLGAGATVDFGGGFTAKADGEIFTTYNGTEHSTITGSDLVFEDGAKWIIDGVEGITTGTEIIMASATTSLSNNLDSADIEYIGASWAAGITAATNGNDLIGTYGYVPLDNALGLDPDDGGFGTAMAQVSGTNGIDFANSADTNYVALKALSSQEAAATVLQEQFYDNSMVGTMIQLQGVFADQIKNRTRSYLRYKGLGGTASASPQGAQGPGLWDKTMDGLNEMLPSWDARKTARNVDDSLPKYDTRGAHEAPSKKAYSRPPKTDKGKIEIPSTWQVWGRGYGSYLKQSKTDDLVGYDATIGGGVLGLDKRFNNLLLGMGGGYAHTEVKGNAGGEDEAVTFYGTAYGAVNGEKGFLEFSANYAFNDVETVGSEIVGDYVGEYDASTASMYVGGGMGFPMFKESVLLTPEVSMLATYYVRESYTETSQSSDPWEDIAWDDYDQWSYLGSVGATLSMIKQIEAFSLEMGFQPEIRAHYLHEFNADMDADSYIQGANVVPVGVALQAREEDLIKLGAGVRFSKWHSDTTEFGLDFDGLFGSDYQGYIFSGKLLHRF